MKYSINKNISRAIVLAQIASDAGKHLYRLETQKISCVLAQDAGYKIKDKFIAEAINLCRSEKSSFNYSIIKSPDQNGNPSFIIYFRTKINGERLQISFHSFNKKLWNDKNNTGEKTHWDKKLNGSFNACKTLIDYYNL